MEIARMSASDALEQLSRVERTAQSELPTLTMTIVARELPGDVREWLNFNERQGEVVMGDLAPIVEPIVRRTVHETLTRTLVR